MSAVPTRYVVELRSDGKPVGFYLHAFEREDEAGRDAGTCWHRDVTRALRFSTRRGADAFIRDEVQEDAVATPVAAADLVRGPHHLSEDEVDDLAAC